MRRLPLLVIFTALLVPHTASAGTIVFFNEQRFVNANTISDGTQELGFWSSSVASPRLFGGGSWATQTSDISPGFIGGIGLAEERNPSDRARSFLQVRFLIDAPFAANLDVELFESGFGSTRVFLRRLDVFEWVWDVVGQPGLTSFSGETILAPGDYHFWMDASSVTPFNAVSSFDGSLKLEPIAEAEVPEPASMTLFGLGLLAAGARRLRRRQD